MTSSTFAQCAEPALESARCCDRFSYRVVKRALDIVVAGTALLLLSPLFSLIALLIKLTSPGPVLYCWKVVGQQGKKFIGYKFRTMTENADDARKDLLPYNERNGPAFKMRNDPRVTRVGRFLRKYSLDEFPQLWSILKGDMTLVGPRPVAPAEWKQFKPWQRRKLTVKPGAVCLWHVNGQPKQFDDWIRLDLHYIDHWSLGMDFRILLAAVAYILSGKNC